MSEEQKTPEIVSESPEVIITDNTSDTTESIPNPEESIDTANLSEQTSSIEDREEEVSSEQEEIFAAFQQENANLKKLLDEKSGQVDLTKAQYARLAADFDNFRRRTTKEKENLELQAKKDVISLLLPVVDNFERARTQLKPESEGEKAIHSSYQGVYKTLVECLKKMGVSAMRPEGKEFDPNFHEAMLREQTDEYAEGTVIEQLMRGYILGDTILRHAMVKVAVPQEPVITSEEKNIEEEPQENNNPSS
ncbi:nucleotide exchange factor GrpE [Waterburya agarophytonicola K14]|uniref:Protein GrpE n=1 Tax=Waterburya agarophytonicola KI4 TaxID=2874699 RepID=A0A964BPY6_9CYAN|nr:nucleotide exchange factor GrpE [Waterburya agarophytonicola]MCC0176348.1 nucleotide exchange factor GrpE [Waterburya agarophytonicola KI4]